MAEALKEYTTRISDLFIGGIVAAAVLLFVNWIQSPTIEDFRDLMSRESMWKQERGGVMSRFDGIDRTNSLHETQVKALWDENKILRNYIDQELRARDAERIQAYNELQRLTIMMEIMEKNLEEIKKKVGNAHPP